MVEIVQPGVGTITAVSVVTDGVHFVTNAVEIDFTSGAVVTDLGAGIAGVAISGLVGSQEKSLTTPDGVQTTFSFTHPPAIIVWNGAIPTLTDDYTVSGNNITFTPVAGIPQPGDTIVNIYA